ncbi:hypothetical protein [Agrobacterium sp. NPDC090273]
MHSLEAKVLAANREDVVSALVARLPAAGNGVVQTLEPALYAYSQA